MELTQSNFLVFKESIEGTDKLYHFSVDTALHEYGLLCLIPNEIYNQAIRLPIDYNNVGSLDVSIVSNDGGILNESFSFGYENILDTNGSEFGATFLSFRFNESVHCCRIKVVADGVAYFSNKINVDADNEERTTLVHYKHRSSIHYIPFEGINDFNTDLYNIIRLPIYYLHPKSEQDSDEYEFYKFGRSIIQPSRVKRRNIEVWNVWGVDLYSQRIAMMSDYDHIYFDRLRRIVRPFEPNDVDLPDYMSESELECQRIDGDVINDDVNILRQPHYSPLHYSPLHYSTNN